MHKCNHILFAVLFALPWAANAQEALLRRADRQYERYSYKEAIQDYERAFALGAHDPMAMRQLADSYRKVRDLANSEKWYAVIASSTGATPEDIYCYADALRSNARYAIADSVMAIFGKLRPSDGRTTRLSHVSDMYPKLLVDPFLEGKLVPQAWNSTAMDMSPIVFGDKLVFSSSRTPQVSIHRTHAWDGLPFLNLYARTDTGSVLLKGQVNTRFHESDATFDKEGREMYFTKNDTERPTTRGAKHGLSNLMIFRSELADGKWTEGAPFAYNSPEFSCGHPCLSADGNTLYFSSDRPGGRGGIDLWKCLRSTGGAWDPPVNLGPLVNTEGNEMFPRMFGNHALFFSSDGHPGLGGLDVFLTWIFGGEAQPPFNVGAPVNSRADDMSLTLLKDGTAGYFSSDRKGGMGSCDIYRIDLDDPFTDRMKIKGRVVSQETGDPIANIPIRLVKPDRSIIAKQLSDKEGRFEFLTAPQPATVLAGIPGASDGELPMDEHLLLVTEDLIELGDISLSTMLDVPITIRAVDQATGLPIAHVHVTVNDGDQVGQLLLDGITDGYGNVRDTLHGVPLGTQLQLRTTLSIDHHPSLTTVIPCSIPDARERLMKQEYNVGEDLMVEFKLLREKLFGFIGDTEDATVWSGRVIDREDHAPIAHVPMTLLDIQNTPLAQTTTDADGIYHLRSNGIPASIIASIPGGERIELNDISPFGDQDLPDLEIDGVMDLPVNAIVHDAANDAAIPGVHISVHHRKDGSLLFDGVTDARGVCQGTIPDRRFGTEEEFDVSFEKEGYTSMTIPVDISVLAFLDQALGGEHGFAMMPSLRGLDLGLIMNLRPIFFDYNQASIRSDAFADLDLVAQVMRQAPDLRIELRTHTDCRGSLSYNRSLSLRRAEHVKQYLVQQGIEPDRLSAFGIGEEEPVNRCVDGVTCDELEHQANRRTEFVLKGDQLDKLVQRKP